MKRAIVLSSACLTLVALLIVFLWQAESRVNLTKINEAHDAVEDRHSEVAESPDFKVQSTNQEMSSHSSISKGGVLHKEAPVNSLLNKAFDMNGLAERSSAGDPESQRRLAAFVSTCRSFGANSENASSRIGELRSAVRNEIDSALVTTFEKCTEIPPEFYHLEGELLISAARSGDIGALRRVRHHPPPKGDGYDLWVDEVIKLHEANKGEPSIVCALASIYMEGLLVKKDLDKAVVIFKEGIEWMPKSSPCYQVALRTIGMIERAES